MSRNIGSCSRVASDSIVFVFLSGIVVCVLFGVELNVLDNVINMYFFVVLSIGCVKFGLEVWTKSAFAVSSFFSACLNIVFVDLSNFIVLLFVFLSVDWFF